MIAILVQLPVKMCQFSRKTTATLKRVLVLGKRKLVSFFVSLVGERQKKERKLVSSKKVGFSKKEN